MEATTRRKKFAPFHKRDRSFYALFLTLCWLGVFLGFYPSTSARLIGHADYSAPLILVVHVLLFSAWIALLTAQIILIRGHNVALHKRLGQVGIVLVPLMAYSAVAAELYSQRFYIHRHDDDLHFFILPLFYAGAFLTFAALALTVARRDPVSHKRLILMGTTVIVGAAYARWWGGALTDRFGDDYWGTIINTFAGTNLLLGLAAGYDLFTRGRLHRTYLIGIPIILVSELFCSLIYHAQWWMPVARQLIQTNIPLSP